MRKYVIIGVQGSGKGTQSHLLGTDTGIVHISLGDMLRWQVTQHTRLGGQIGDVMDAGQLVPDEITERLIAARLDEHDWNYGFVIDGFPRSSGQAAFLLARYDIDAVIHLDLPDSEVWARVEGRRRAAQCENCGGPMTGQSAPRQDDTTEALSVRIREYHQQSGQVLEEFRRKGEYVVTVDARPSPEAVQQDIRSKLGLPPYKAALCARSRCSAAARTRCWPGRSATSSPSRNSRSVSPGSPTTAWRCSSSPTAGNATCSSSSRWSPRSRRTWSSCC